MTREFYRSELFGFSRLMFAVLSAMQIKTNNTNDTCHHTDQNEKLNRPEPQ